MNQIIVIAIEKKFLLISANIIPVFLILRVFTINYTLTNMLEMLFACVVVKNFLTVESCWVYF